MGELIAGIIIFVLLSLVIMVGASVLFAVFTAVVPFVAIIMVVCGVAIGLFTAVKNAFSVYKQVYFTKRR